MARGPAREPDDVRELLIGCVALVVADVFFSIVWGDDHTVGIRGTPRSNLGPLLIGASVFTLVLTGLKAWWQRRR
ncbi:hypothetical protein [Kineococcus sp. SYSU DK005]|uniref:hypothetical protein n=1 Tax=Kineococcus sp. SYSU DK005 TaxID=3383126 RepID=UPI003D7DED7D